MEDINFESSSNWWNHRNPNKDNYSAVLSGTVVEFALVPRRKFGSTNEYERYRNGGIMENYKLTIADANGTEWQWEFKPGPRSNPSVPFAAIKKGMAEAGIKPFKASSMAGLAVTIWTEEGTYSMQHPRPYGFRVDGQGDPALVHEPFFVDAMPKEEGAPAPIPPQPVAVPQQIDPVLQASMMRAATSAGVVVPQFQQVGYQPQPAPQPAYQQQAIYPGQYPGQVPYTDQDIPF